MSYKTWLQSQEAIRERMNEEQRRKHKAIRRIHPTAVSAYEKEKVGYKKREVAKKMPKDGWKERIAREAREKHGVEIKEGFNFPTVKKQK